MKSTISQIGAGQFKMHCLRLIDEVSTKHVSLVITKHGKPLARLVPFNESVSFYGYMKGSVIIKGDIIEGTGEQWEAEA